MLDRDEAYDQDPNGEPPISVLRYRRALRAAIDVGPEFVAEQGMPRSGAEAKAYSAGVRDALDTVVGAIARGIERVQDPAPPADEPPRTEK
ncbi:hypothetical protein [Frankia sp. CiP1_Cm_nod1]